MITSIIMGASPQTPFARYARRSYFHYQSAPTAVAPGGPAERHLFY